MINPVTLYVYDKPVELSVETIEKTFQWYADHAKACAEGAKAGDFFVNDIDGYVMRCNVDALNYERQKIDGPDGRLSLAFLQRAYYIQTGESVPLLSK